MNVKLNRMKLLLFDLSELTEMAVSCGSPQCKESDEVGVTLKPWHCSTVRIKAFRQSHHLPVRHFRQEREKRVNTLAAAFLSGNQTWCLSVNQPLSHFWFLVAPTCMPSVENLIQLKILLCSLLLLSHSPDTCPVPMIARGTLKFFLTSSLKVLEVSRVSRTNGQGWLWEKMKVFAYGEIFHVWTTNSHILLLARVGLSQSWLDIPLVASKANQKVFYLLSPSIYHSLSSPTQSIFLNKFKCNVSTSSLLIQFSTYVKLASISTSVLKLSLQGQ